MTYKHTMAINKAWFNAGMTSLSPVGIITRLKNAIKFEIPTGYQDESGFHMGVKAVEKDIKWPSVW
jgi:hypothetical protein